VDMTIPAISRRTTIPREIIERGIEALLLPDIESRTPTEGGRRIIPLSDGRAWGWKIVNYEKYRQIKREQDRRDYHREYYHRRKSSTSARTQHDSTSQPIAEAEAETPPQPPKGESVPTGFAEFWALYPKKVGKDAALSAWKRKVKGDHGVVIDSIKTQKAQEAWTKEGGRFVPNPATWLNQGRWKDEVGQGGECSAAADWTRGAV
ncbi:MAG: hypothetical protein ACRC8U_02845, partial [Brooklawnia sp.]